MVLKDTPIQRKLMTVIMLTSSTVLLLTSSAFIAYEWITFKQTLANDLKTLARITAFNSTAIVDFKNETEAQKILGALKAEKQIMAAALYDQAGRLFARYPESTPISVFPEHPEKRDCRFEGGYLIVFEPVVEAQNQLGTLFLKSDLHDRNDRFELYGAIMAAVMASSFLVALILSNVLQKRISKPVLALAATARFISERKDYSVRAHKVSNDELGLLTDAFNHMLTQIQDRDTALLESEERLRVALDAFRRLNAELEQRVLERTAELASTNKELEAFTYSVSHDLRAPLRHIDAFSQILQEEFSKDLPAEAQQYIHRIRHGTQNMGRLVDDLLNLAHVGRQELNWQTVDMQHVVQEVIRELGAETKEREVEWSIGALDPAQGDPGLIKQVFANLLSNAVKYTRPRPRALIEVNQTASDGQRIYFVRDNGVGFSMKYAHKLFGVFQRLHRAEEFEGTGVGLATVDRIIRKHGGRVWAEAEPERGATFYFTLNGAPKEG